MIAHNPHVFTRESTNDSYNDIQKGSFKIQENGQRKYGGPPAHWQGPPPTRGCEVFVDEDKLFSLMSSVGSIYEMRIMIDFSGANRGYCFVLYATKEAAKNAVIKLNNYELHPGQRIGVMMSVDNRRLFVGGIPRERTCEEVKVQLEQLVSGIIQVILYPSANDKSKNRGFVFVEFESHRNAAMARQKLIRDRVQLWGQQLCVDWAEPEQDVDESTMQQVRILYVRNLMLTTTEQALHDFFDSIRPNSIERVKKIKDFAFVHFATREDADSVLQNVQGLHMDGAQLEVMWAKPPDRSIMRYVRNSMKNSSLPAAPHVHQSIVQAAAAQLMVAAQQPVIPPGQLTPPTSGTPPSPPATNSINASDSTVWAYAGAPLLDSGCALYNTVLQAQQEANAIRYARGAAGMRGAGFQAFVNHQARRNRRKCNEQLEMFCVDNQLGEPLYEMNVVTLKSGDYRDVQVHLCKITIPGLVERYGSFVPTKPWATPEEAKQSACLFTLVHLGVRPESLS